LVRTIFRKSSGFSKRRKALRQQRQKQDQQEEILAKANLPYVSVDDVIAALSPNPSPKRAKALARIKVLRLRKRERPKSGSKFEPQLLDDPEKNDLSPMTPYGTRTRITDVKGRLDQGGCESGGMNKSKKLQEFQISLAEGVSA
jgi:hypothetical protein